MNTAVSPGIGILATIVLSVVPANDRPVSGAKTLYRLCPGGWGICNRLSLLTNPTSGIGCFLLQWN